MFKILENINNITRKANYRAMNRALATVNTQYKRKLSKATNLKASDVQRRLSLRKATLKKQSVSLSVGVKYGIALDYFKPRVKIIKKNNRKYYGVSAMLPQQGRVVIPDAFIMRGKNNKYLVVKRKTKRKFPVERIRHSIADTAKSFQNEHQTLLKEKFREEFNRQIKLLTK